MSDLPHDAATAGPAAAPDPSTEAAPPEGRPPAVLQVLPRLEGGGVERGAIDVAIALRMSGWGSVVASAGGAMTRELARHDIPHVTLPVDSKNPFVMRANVRRLVDVIADHRIDIVHARSRAPAWSAEAAARRTNVRFVTTFHGTYGAANALKRLYNAVMTRGERVIAISGFVARHVQETYGVDPDRLRMIHRGVDVGLFDPDRVSQERMIQLSVRWKLPDDRRIVLMPGRFSRWKGHRLVIEALARLGRDDLRCVMVGADTASAAYLAELEALAHERDVGDLVQFVDFCRDMPAAYMLSDAVLSAATRPEAFGRTVAEALAMGRPAVAPAHGGAPEIIEEGRTGWLFAPGDPDTLAAALATALDLAPEARDRLASEAMRTIRTGFTNDAMCRATLEVYAEVLGAAAAPAPGTGG